MTSLKCCIVSMIFLSNMATLVQPLPPISKQDVKYFEEIDESMTQIYKTIVKISAFLQPKMAKTCTKNLGELENAHTDWNPNAIYGHGDRVKVSCKRGFSTDKGDSEQTVKCLLGNAWSLFKPCSQMTCSKKPLQDTDTLEIHWSPETFYAVGDAVTVSCKNGTRPSNPDRALQTAICLEGNEWSSVSDCLPACPRPYTLFGEICYNINRTKMKYSDAVRHCENEFPDFGSRLMMPKTANKQRDVIVMARQNHFFESDPISLWIAASDRDKEGFYIWDDGTPMTLLHPDFSWLSGEPNSYDKDEDCIHLKREGGLNDMWCYDNTWNYPFCEIPLDLEP